jgi:hypothetical protein
VGSAGCGLGLAAALRAQEGALFRHRALMDAASLGERLRSVPPEARLADSAAWQAELAGRRVAAQVSVGDAPGEPPDWVVRLGWQDRAASSAVQLDLTLGVPP